MGKGSGAGVEEEPVLSADFDTLCCIGIAGRNKHKKRESSITKGGKGVEGD